MNTEATASAIGTPRRASAVARTASPPTLAGRNVPTKVLTKKTCRMAPRPTRGRLASPGGGANGTSSHSQRHAISVRSRTTRRTAATSGPGRALARLLPDEGRVALPEDERGQAQGDGQPEDAAGRRQAGRADGHFGGGHRRQRLEMTRRISLHLDGAAEELRVRHDLLHRADVDLARAQARLADRVVEGGAVGEVLGLVVEIAGRHLADVADLLRVLAVEQRAVRVEEQALRLERARHRALIAVGDHVGVVQVHERLAREDALFLDAVEEEGAACIPLRAGGSRSTPRGCGCRACCR